MPLSLLPNIKLCLVLFLLPQVYASAQAQPDQQQVFTLEQFLRQVAQHHPVARQAALLPEQARQELRMAKGFFDPAISSKLSRKEFKGTEYYTYWDNTLLLPTTLGVDFRAGYERNDGVYQSRDKTVPESGLTYAGLSVPLAQGLLIDERRATLRLARLLPELAEAERVSQVNKLLLQATKDYWDWAFYYHKNRLNRQSLDFATERLLAVRARALAGDLATIDTVEAQIEALNRQVMLRQSEVELENSRLVLSTHIWQENDQPAELSPEAVPLVTAPGSEDLADVQALLQSATENHPDIRKLKVKQEQLQIDRRLYTNKLLPKINADYNVLQSGGGLNNEVLRDSYFSNNYKLGISVNYPLFLRSERGKLQIAKLKITDNNLVQQQTKREIEAGVLAAYNELLGLRDQIGQQQQLVENARLLRNGESVRFQNGESTLFLINTREMSLINQEVKLYELLAKYAKARTVLDWSAGAVAP